MLEIFRRSRISTIYVLELTLVVRRLIRPTGSRNCEKIVPLNTAATSRSIAATGVLFKKTPSLYVFVCLVKKYCYTVVACVHVNRVN